MEWLIQILNSVQYGLLLFLVASGLTLIFGIMGVINLAHGSFYMVGAYLAFSLTQYTGSLWLALPLGVVLAAALGLLLEWLLISRLYRHDHLYQVLLTFGLILVFEELRSILFGDDVHSVAIPSLLAASLPLTDTLSYPVYRLFISARVSRAGGRDVPDHPDERDWVPESARRRRTPTWHNRSGSTSAGSTRWCSPPASRSRRSPA